MVAFLREQLQELSLYRSFKLEEKLCSYYSRLIDDNLKKKIKNQILYTRKFFQLT